MARADRVVFFDVGNVLVDDDPLLAEAFYLIYQGLPEDSPKAHPERFWGDVERAMRAHGHKAVDRMGTRCHGRLWPKQRKRIQQQISEKWGDLVRMIPAAGPVLERIREACRLGIIANQPPRVVECLKTWGLLHLFDVVVLDSSYGISKPDPTLFRLALAQARADADHVVMVGDRLDNDIIPARRMGMRAVLFWLGASEKGWQPDDEWRSTFRAILERLPAPRWDGIPPKERPLALARSWEELPGALDQAWAAQL